MSDKILFSSPCFGSCDIVKILSVVAIELYILAPYGVKFFQGYAARAKISHLLAETPILGQNCHIWLVVAVQTFRQYPFMIRDNDHISAHQVPSVMCD